MYIFELSIFLPLWYLVTFRFATMYVIISMPNLIPINAKFCAGISQSNASG